jgi:paraquat-inducible protein A
MDKLTQALQHPKMLLSLLVLVTLLLIAGMCLPVMTINTLIFLRHSFSVISGIYDLLIEGKYFLFVVVLTFSVILPLAKLGFLFAIVLGQLKHSDKTQQYLNLLHDYGRWAMLDVFVVALLIVSVKLRGIATVQIHYGFYIFSCAVLLIMWITHLAVKGLDREKVRP